MTATCVGRGEGAARSAAVCPGVLHIPSILDLVFDVFKDVSKGEKSVNRRQMRRGPRGRSSSMVATVGEGGGAARSAAMSAIVMRGLLGASAAFSVFSWALIFRRLPADAFKYFSHDLRVR